MCTPTQCVGVLRTTAQILWEGEEQKGEEKGKKSISNPAIDRPRTAKRITVQRTTRKLLLLSIGHVAVIYCLVFRDYLSGGALVAVPRLSLFSSSKSDYVVPGFFRENLP